MAPLPQRLALPQLLDDPAGYLRTTLYGSQKRVENQIRRLAVTS